MNLAQTMALIVPPVDDLKRSALKRSDGEHTMFPTLVALRDDRVLAVVMTPRLAITLSAAHTIAVGLAADCLAVAAQADLPDGSQALTFTTMSRDKQAGFAVQGYAVKDEQIHFEAPEKGKPQDHSVMDELARAMSHDTLDPTRVGMKNDDGTSTKDSQFISADEGRLAIDAGTAASVHRTVNGIGGTTLLLAVDSAHATRLLAHGLPKEVLLGGSST